MKAIPPIQITDSNLASSKLLEPHWANTHYPNFVDPPVIGSTSGVYAWDKVNAYRESSLCYVPDKYRIYQSVLDVAANTDTRPDRDPTSWADVGPYEVVWQSATACPVGAQRIRRETHRTYLALRAITTGDTTPPEDAPTVWQDIGPTNAWMLYDTHRNTQCIAPRGLPPRTGILPGVIYPPGFIPPAFFEIIIKPKKRCDSIAFVALDATSIQISITRETDATVVYSKTVAISQRSVFNWTDYFFAPFRPIKAYVLDDLPMYGDAVISITITSTRAAVKCGAVVLGRSVEIGKVLTGARSGALNFSKVDRDDFGNAALRPRRSVPKVNARLIAEKDKANVVLDLREQLNAVPAVWVGLDTLPGHAYYESVLILGIYKQMEVDMQYANHMYIDLELEEI